MPLTTNRKFALSVGKGGSEYIKLYPLQRDKNPSKKGYPGYTLNCILHRV